jgi:uncharacterized protein YjeT (DUF2065 family)
VTRWLADISLVPKSLDLGVGILMAVTGVYCFACLPVATRRYATLQKEGKVAAEEVKSKLKNLKLVGLCSLVVGVGLICIYAFHLY